MNQTDMTLFGQALDEAMANRFERELTESRTDAKCSAWHKRRMRRIVKGKIVEPRTRAENQKACSAHKARNTKKAYCLQVL